MAHFYKPAKKSSAPSLKTLSAIKIERLSDDGRGIASITPNTKSGVNSAAPTSGKTVFIEGALAQETVNANIVKHSARYSEAYAKEIISASEHRRQAQCQYYSRCGGCQTQHMAIQEQHRFKLQATLDQLKKWAGLVPETLLPTLAADQYHYRRRARLGVDSRKLGKNNKPVMGFRQKNSQQLIRVTQCPVLLEVLEAMIEPIQAWLNKYLPAVSHIELIGADSAPAVLVRYTQSLSVDIRRHLQEKLHSFDALCWFQGKKQGQLEDAEGKKVNPELEYLLQNLPSREPLRFYFHPQDFIQGNAKVNQLMVNQALELMQPQASEHILDLFCGVGNFSLPLSRLAESVTGVEGIESMALTAASNAKRNHCDNTRFIALDLSNWRDLESSEVLSKPCDGLILDPPRSGAKSVCENIDKLMPKRIVYVSCDSATFARDAQLLCKHDYTLSKLGMLDMFPQTSHSEVMGLFIHPSWKELNSATVTTN